MRSCFQETAKKTFTWPIPAGGPVVPAAPRTRRGRRLCNRRAGRSGGTERDLFGRRRFFHNPRLSRIVIDPRIGLMRRVSCPPGSSSSEADTREKKR